MMALTALQQDPLSLLILENVNWKLDLSSQMLVRIISHTTDVSSLYLGYPSQMSSFDWQNFKQIWSSLCTQCINTTSFNMFHNTCDIYPRMSI